MSFRDIKGHDKAIEILKGHIRESRLGNGYLFVGPEGIGKAMVAKTLAKAVNCQEETLDSCDKCASCLKIEKNQYPDVYMVNRSNSAAINPEQNNTDSPESSAIKIEHIRQLQRDIILKPYEGRQKVFIIDNAHNLTAEASNALLKILEEPPPKSLIILVTAKPTLLFKTIISRCQIIKFYPLARKELMDVLNKDYGADRDFAHYLAYFCEGRLGHALALKGKDILREKNRIIDTLVSLGQPKFEDLSIKTREEVRSYLNILATWFRDIYLIKIGMPYSELINLDRKAELLRSMQQFSFVGLEQIFNCISNSIFYLQQNINIRLLLSNLGEEIIYRANQAR